MADDPYAKYRQSAPEDPYAKYTNTPAPSTHTQAPQRDLGERVMGAILDPVVNSATILGRGIHALLHGGKRPLVQSKITFPEDNQPWQKTASDLIEGGAGISLPFALPSIISRPLAAAAGAAIGAGTQKAGEGAARLFGASPETTRLVGDVTGMAGGPLVERGLGSLIQKPAPRLFENALGIKPTETAHGAQPGKFGLEETSGVRPATVAKQARSAITRKSADLDTALTNAQNNGVTLDVSPARGLVRSRINQASGANSVVTPRELQPMENFFTEPTPNFKGNTAYPPGAHTPITITAPNSPILGPNGQPMPGLPVVTRGASPTPLVSNEQPPLQFRDMKSQFDTDFIRNWNPTVNTKGQLGVARDAYHELSSELNRKIPGAADLNNGMQSLIPVANAAEKTQFRTGPAGRIIDRFTRPTGGLVAPLLAYGKGGPVGAAAMMTGQELMADPTTKLLISRGLWNGGRALQSPQAATGAGLIPLAFRGQ